MSEKYPDIIFGGGGGVIHWLEWCDSRNSTTKKIGCTTPIPPAITTQLCEYIYKKKSVFFKWIYYFPTLLQIFTRDFSTKNFSLMASKKWYRMLSIKNCD